MDIGEGLKKELLGYQLNEITEYHIYRKLSRTVKTEENRDILLQIADDELRHYKVWKTYTQEDVEPDMFKVWKFFIISKIFGFTFGIKLMEEGEENAQENYNSLPEEIGSAQEIIEDENDHENALINMLDEDRLRYMGSVVLGLNDALVELTGALAGFTFALQNTSLVALTGLITGIAAALSMGASEYLSTKAEETAKKPLKASVYTTIAYVFAVFFLILPFLIFKNPYLCLGCTICAAILIIAFFNYYVSVAKSVPFKRRFLEMTGLSLGVAGISFLIGLALRVIIGVEV